MSIFTTNNDLPGVRRQNCPACDATLGAQPSDGSFTKCRGCGVTVTGDPATGRLVVADSRTGGMSQYSRARNRPAPRPTRSRAADQYARKRKARAIRIAARDGEKDFKVCLDRADKELFA